MIIPVIIAIMIIYSLLQIYVKFVPNIDAIENLS